MLTKNDISEIFKPTKTCPLCGIEIKWKLNKLKHRLKATGKHYCEKMNGNCTLTLWSKKF